MLRRALERPAATRHTLRHLRIVQANVADGVVQRHAVDFLQRARIPNPDQGGGVGGGVQDGARAAEKHRGQSAAPCRT